MNNKNNRGGNFMANIIEDAEKGHGHIESHGDGGCSD